jgi:hypothetical protein
VLGELARLHATRLHERAKPGLAGTAELDEPLPDDAAILAVQRDQVAHGGQRGKVHVRGGLGRIATGSRVERLAQLQHHPRGAQLRAAVAAEGWMHDRAVGQRRAGTMVVGHDHVEARGPCSGHRLDRGDAAVDGHEQLHASRGEPANGAL